MAAIDLPQGWTWEGVLARLGEHADLEKSARNHGGVGGGGGTSIVFRCCPTEAAQTLRAVAGGVGWHNWRAYQSRGNLRRPWAAYRGGRCHHHLLARGR